MRIILGLFVALSPLPGQVRIGQQAPDLIPREVLQGRLDHAGKGRARLLEFWATWCGPCIDTIPHLNELANQFASRDIDFVSITAEDRAPVETFLKTHPIRGVIALDPGERIKQTYGGHGIPTTVLIDRNGRVVRVIYPTQVSAKVLEDLIADRPVNLPAIRPEMFLPPGFAPSEVQRKECSCPNTVVKTSIAPSTKKPSEYGGIQEVGDYMMTAKGVDLPHLLAYAYNLSLYQVQVSKYFQGGEYAVEAWVPSERSELLKPMLRNALEAAIDYHPTIEKHLTDVVVLKGVPGTLVSASELTGCRIWPNDCEGQPISTLIMAIEGAYGMPVVVERPLKGWFRWSLKGDLSTPSGLKSALHDQLHLDLEIERRQVDVLIIDSAEKTR
jgi:thiol-disulfide isomerase/thioredoxin